MIDTNDPALLSELLAILVKQCGGEVVLTGNEIGPHELRFVEADNGAGGRLLILRVVEPEMTRQ